MLISHKHKFVYIKTVKTAGTSVQSALTYILGDNDIASGVREIIRPDGSTKIVIHQQNIASVHHQNGGHHKLDLAFTIAPEAKDYRVITTERNSWDRVLSFYFHSVSQFGVTIPFERWLSSFNAQRAVPGGFGKLYPLKRANFVIQYHTLQQDWLRLGKYLGVTMPLLGHLNANESAERNKDYTTFYTPKTRDIVAKMCAAEINWYGYTFGET